jgi:Spy/CpxP family protein refolding chaperone
MERNHSDRTRAGLKRRLWPASALAVVTLLMAAALWAQPQEESAPPDPAWGGPGRGPGPGPGPHGWCGGDMRGLRQRLDLTDEQVTQLESLRSDFLKETIDLDAQIQKKRLELGDLFRDPQAKQEKIEAAQKELNRLTAQKQEKAQAYRLKARGLLTADQIKKLPPGCSFGIPWAGTMCPGGPGLGRGPGPRAGCPYAM